MSGTCSLAVVASEVKHRELLCNIAEKNVAVELVEIEGRGRLNEAKLFSIKPEIILCDFECLGALQRIREVTAQDLDAISEVVWICKSASKKFFDDWAMEQPQKELLVVVVPENDGEKTFAWEISVALEKAVSNRHAQKRQAHRTSKAKTKFVKSKSFSASNRYGKNAKSLATFIGISTGGPEALASMIPSLPADLSGPVFIVQHMPANFTDSLARTLNQRSDITVVEAKNGMEVQPGMVYLAPGGQRHMKVIRDVKDSVVMHLVRGAPVNNCQPSADVLFRSAIDVYGDRALGIVMTGMGTDGAQGLAEMKQCGCSTAVQDEKTSVVFGMPGESIKAGAAQVVLPLGQIAGYIVRRMGSVYEHSAYAR